MYYITLYFISKYLKLKINGLNYGMVNEYKYISLIWFIWFILNITLILVYNNPYNNNSDNKNESLFIELYSLSLIIRNIGLYSISNIYAIILSYSNDYSHMV